MNVMTIAQQVKQDLQQLANLGVHAAQLDKAIKYVNTHEEEVNGYYASGMTVSEISDLVSDLVSIA